VTYPSPAVPGPPPGTEPPETTLDRLARTLFLDLRAGRPRADDVAALACHLMEWGLDDPAVREAVERDPAGVPPAECAALARRVLAAVDFDPGFALAPERLDTLRRALTVLARDLATAGLTGEHRVEVDPDAYPEQARVLLADGRVLGSCGLLPVDGLPAALAALAAGVQEELMLRTETVWPVCPWHGLGVHVAERDGEALWWCAGGDAGPDPAGARLLQGDGPVSGGHALARIGELAGAGPRRIGQPSLAGERAGRRNG
jgi:hypothetical protein